MLLYASSDFVKASLSWQERNYDNASYLIQPTPLSGRIYSIRLNVFLALSIRWIKCTPEGTGLSCQPKWCRQRATPKNPQILRSWDGKGGRKCRRTECNREYSAFANSCPLQTDTFRFPLIQSRHVLLSSNKFC